MPAPFVVNVLSDRPEQAERLARALTAALAPRKAIVRIQTGERLLKGTVAAVGVLGPEGVPSWLSPLPADGREDEVAERLVQFLERWGFIRAASATPAS